MVGELVQRQFRIGLLRMVRNTQDRMSMSEIETVQTVTHQCTPSGGRRTRVLRKLTVQPVYRPTINPLSELAHKRRLSSMGPGGLSRERAGFEVRDAHATHYGRICAVETPEGANVGLVLNLANFARIDYGFVETPYRKVVKGKVTDEIIYLDAAAEEHAVIAGAGVTLDKTGTILEDRVSARAGLESLPLLTVMT